MKYITQFILALLLSLAAAAQNVPMARADGTNVSGEAWKTNLGFLEAADVSGSYQPLIADGGLSLAKLSTTGTANSSTYLRGDGAWTAVSGGAWGSITGTLSSQTDLQTALDAKMANTNTALNTAIATDPAASRVAMEVARRGQPGAGVAATALSAVDNNGYAQVNSLSFGDSISIIPERQLQAALGVSGAVQSLGDGDGTTGATYNPVTSSVTAVNTSTETMTSAGHLFETGDRIRITWSSMPGGLTSTQSFYFAIKVDVDNFKVADSYATAIGNTPINLTSAGSGVAVAPAIESTNSHTDSYTRSFTGTSLKLRQGNVIFHQYGASGSGILGRQIEIWYWSATGGGTFRVDYDTSSSGSYTTLTNANSTLGGTGVFSNAAAGTVDAAEGGTGVLRRVTFLLGQHYFTRVKVVGLSGSPRIICGGVMESHSSSAARLGGFTNINCAIGGTDPSQWNQITDASLQTLLDAWQPKLIFVRGAETLANWQTSFGQAGGLGARIRALRPSAQIIITGTHVSGAEYPLDSSTGAVTRASEDANDKYCEQWASANDGLFVPVRKRMGDFAWSVRNRLCAVAGTATISSGSNSTDTVTTSANHGQSAGSWVRFASLTGGSSLVVGEPYQIATVPAANQMTFRKPDGTAADFGSDITAGTITLIDGIHQSEPGKEYVTNLMTEAMLPLMVARFNVNGNSVDGTWNAGRWNPDNIQSFYQDRVWNFLGPGDKKRSIKFGRVDGSNTSASYNTGMELGVNPGDIAFINSSLDSGWGQTFDANYGFLGTKSTRWMGRTTGGVGERTEIFSGGTSLAALTVSGGQTTTAHAPLQVWRAGATANDSGPNTGEGTEVARLDATGQLKSVIRTFADDAAADADSTLLSGMLYRTTAGGRTVFQKP